MKRQASAQWAGDLKAGKGTVSTQSGVLSHTQYSFTTRFENGIGTNPEELIAAAHAGCFTMALSAQLGNAGLVPEKLETTATVSFDKLDAGWTVTGIHLTVKGKVPKADAAAWDKATQAAKTGCPISRLLNTTITMDAQLEG
jgi:osmotically inducible protein OsmC